jgi:hypothetical protein
VFTNLKYARLYTASSSTLLDFGEYHTVRSSGNREKETDREWGEKFRPHCIVAPGIIE